MRGAGNRVKDEILTDLAMAVIALKCTKNLIELIKHYYDTIEKPDELVITDGREVSKNGLQYVEQRVNNFRSYNTVSMDKEDYLADLIQSKIEIIDVIGNFKLLKRVYEELKIHERYEPEYPLAEIFSTLATGIGGWSS